MCLLITILKELINDYEFQLSTLSILTTVVSTGYNLVQKYNKTILFL